MELINRLDRGLAKIEEVLLALLLVGMVVLAALQVVLRNVWNTGIDWADVSLQNVTLLLGLLGGAVATSEGRHLNIDLFSRTLSGRSQAGLRVAIGLFAVAICGLLTRGGMQTYGTMLDSWRETIPAGWTASQTLWQQLGEGTFPPWTTQLMLPCGFGLIGFHFLLRLIRDAGTLITGTAWESTQEAFVQGDALLDQMTESAEDERGAP